jgi:hypothetical protein
MCGSVKKREKEKMKKRNFKLKNILTIKNKRKNRHLGQQKKTRKENCRKNIQVKVDNKLCKF